MFKVRTTTPVVSFYIQDDDVWKEFLHSDGSVWHTVEYWPTRELAQAVLDKYQPQHVWKHGDVFKSHKNGEAMMYTNALGEQDRVFYLCSPPDPYEVITTPVQEYLDKNMFLFNIKDALDDRGIPCPG